MERSDEDFIIGFVDDLPFQGRGPELRSALGFFESTVSASTLIAMTKRTNRVRGKATITSSHHANGWF